MRRYRQLTFEDRIYIEVMHWERLSRGEIARRLSVHPTTISREMDRGSTGPVMIGYRADLAEKRRREGARRKGRRRKIRGDLERIVIEKLRRGWSPEQISGRLRLEGYASVSHETIYQYVAADRERGGGLFLHLRRSGRKRRKRFSVPRIRADLLNRKWIDERPKVINERRRIGDWERDLVFGDSRSEALLTLVERKTRFLVLRKVRNKSPYEIARKTIRALSRLKPLSITNDNGFEFRAHERESRVLRIPIYFTHPYSSWEKGSCENANGLLRQYFPKGASVHALISPRLRQTAEALNSRPRKGLGFRTPKEAFFASRSALIF